MGPLEAALTLTAGNITKDEMKITVKINAKSLLLIIITLESGFDKRLLMKTKNGTMIPPSLGRHTTRIQQADKQKKKKDV